MQIEHLMLAPPTYKTQKEMMAVGKPEDPCGRCGCRRGFHRPDKYFNYAKSGASSGKSHNVLVLAVTSCECKHCFCFCVGFVEPYDGQPFLKCIYAH